MLDKLVSGLKFTGLPYVMMVDFGNQSGGERNARVLASGR
jgi:hypothetical protein